MTNVRVGAVAAVSGAAIFLTGLTTGDAGGPWVAFRYNSTAVLFYVAQGRDTVAFTQPELTNKQLRQPIARWGQGGYLMPLSRERLPALQPNVEEAILRGLSKGELLTVRVSGKETVTARCDGFIEQWGAANPQVRIGVLARITPNRLIKFQSNPNNYFLAFKGAEPLIQVQPRNQQITGARQVLNQFGSIGALIVVEGDAGWNVALWRRVSGKLIPTDIAYSYGD